MVLEHEGIEYPCSRLAKARIDIAFNLLEKRRDKNMDRKAQQEQLHILGWEYKMHQYLLGYGYWSYVEGANKVAREPTNRDFPA